MEQNLTERERKQRLAVGITFGFLAGASYLYLEQVYVAAALAAASAGFIANYFTCFCGTKKAVEELKDRL